MTPTGLRLLSATCTALGITAIVAGAYPAAMMFGLAGHFYAELASFKAVQLRIAASVSGQRDRGEERCL